MVRLINCSRCGRFFESNGFTSLCTYCLEQDIKDFDKIREYLYKNPGAKMFEVSTNLDISVLQIKRYLREGRLEILEKNNQFLKCERCSKPISSGSYCDDCLKHVNHDFKTAYVGNSLKTSKHHYNYTPYYKNALAE